MNVPTKILKTNMNQTSQTQTISQSLVKKYYKIYKKTKLQNASKKEVELVNPNFIKEKDFQTNNFIQEKALNWFFNLDLSSRIKIVSIKNKSLVNILYQMYVHSSLDPKVKFQIRSPSSEEVEDIYPIIYTNNSTSTSYINLNVNSNKFTNSENSVTTYLQYFHTNNCVQSNIHINNFIKNNDVMERELIKEVKFYKCEEHNDTMSLSHALLTNEVAFRKYFSYFSNDKYFNNYLSPGQDQSKQFYLNLPDWMNGKEHYTFYQILIAYFEQVILAWFFFSQNLDKKSFFSLLLQLPCEKKVTSLLEDVENVITFLKKNIHNNMDRKKMLDEINLRSVSISIRKDNSVAEMISIRKRTWENITHYCYTSLYNHHLHEKRNTTELLEDVENIVRCNFYNFAEEHFIENLIFTPLDRIFFYEDFFGEKMWDEIHNMYTKYNALELIEELSSSCSSNARKSSNQSAPKKNTKKNKKNKKTEKEENSPFNSSGEDKNLKESDAILDIKDTENNFEKPEQPEVNSNLYDCESYIKSLVANIISKALDHVDSVIADRLSYKCDNSEILTKNEANTASSITCDKNEDLKNVISLKHKKENKNFFLYTVNPSHLNNINSKKKGLNSNNGKDLKSSKNTKTKNGNTKSLSECSSPTKNTVLFSQEKKPKVKPEINTKEIENTTQIQISSPNSEVWNKNINDKNMTIEKDSYCSNKLSEDNLEIMNSQNNNISPESKDHSSQKVSNQPSNNINITINAPVYNNYYIINNSNSMKFPSQNSNRRNSFHNSNYNNNFTGSITQKQNLRKFSLNNQPNSNNHLNMKKCLGMNFMPPEDMNYLCNISSFPIQNHFRPPNGFDNYNKLIQYGNLHNDIINYSREVNENVFALKGLKISIIKKIEEMIKETLTDYSICLGLYGSFATDLEIESSDIDIMVKYKSKQLLSNSPQNYMSSSYTIESIMLKLVKCFTDKNVFCLVNAIYTATVPVIKLQININTMLDESERSILDSFKSSQNYKDYRFDKEELEKVKIDLTFMNIGKSILGFNTFESPSQQAVDYVKNSLLCFPEIRPLMHVMKRYLQVDKLNCSFNGGLSSFCLFLLILAFMKMKKFNQGLNVVNLGSLLAEFLDFYSNFNFSYTFIDVNSASPFIVNNEILDQIPLILDPITYLNVGKSSYRIEDVKQSFIKSSNQIYRTLFNFNISSEKKQNIIYSLFTKMGH